MSWKQVNAYYGKDEGYSIIPSLPGNYAIYSCSQNINKFGSPKLHYIGTARNLARRLSKHEVIRVLRSVTEDYIFIKCCVITNTDKRLDREYNLIKRLRPGANSEPKKRRSSSNAILCR